MFRNDLIGSDGCLGDVDQPPDWKADLGQWSKVGEEGDTSGYGLHLCSDAALSAGDAKVPSFYSGLTVNESFVVETTEQIPPEQIGGVLADLKIDDGSASMRILAASEPGKEAHVTGMVGIPRNKLRYDREDSKRGPPNTRKVIDENSDMLIIVMYDPTEISEIAGKPKEQFTTSEGAVLGKEQSRGNIHNASATFLPLPPTSCIAVMVGKMATMSYGSMPISWPRTIDLIVSPRTLTSLNFLQRKSVPSRGVASSDESTIFGAMHSEKRKPSVSFLVLLPMLSLHVRSWSTLKVADNCVP